MSVSNISGRASVLVSSLLVAVLLLWKFQLPERFVMAGPVRQSQNDLPPLKTTEPIAVAVFALPPPPSLASRKEALLNINTTVLAQKPPVEKPKARIVQVSITDHSSEAKGGRALLRLLEHGSGPTIEIAWPDGRSARSSLYGLLRDCYGMKTALMDSDGGLYVSGVGRKWRPDMDRFSGFVRQPSGILPPGEGKEAGVIRRRHGLGLDSTIVRLFPRRIDAVLMGGLQSLLGGRYQNSKIIRASYRQVGSRLFIDNVTANGAVVRGRISFSTAQTKCG